MSRLRGGYTNRTRLVGRGMVEKQYDGLDARARAEREYECLTRLSGRLPLPDVLGIDLSGPTLTLREAQGTHGQDLMDAGHATEVLRHLGSMLLRLRAIETAAVPGLAGAGNVIVHGDFGPQNVVIHEGEISALLDWEFAHLGHPVEDLAWAEWIVRMHHASQRDNLPELFSAAELEPEWMNRHTAMVSRCVDLLRRVERFGQADAVALWHERLRLTESWTE